MSGMKEQARRLYRTLDTQDFVSLDKLVGAEIAVQLGSAPPIVASKWKDMLSRFYSGFPDGHHVIDNYLIDGDRVATRCRFVGTHTGIFQNILQSGRRVSVGAIHIDRFAGGKLIEHFGQLDALGLSEQISETD